MLDNSRTAETAYKACRQASTKLTKFSSMLQLPATLSTFQPLCKQQLPCDHLARLQLMVLCANAASITASTMSKEVQRSSEQQRGSSH